MSPRLARRLAQRDPKTAALLRPTDPQRVLRAYEVFEATGVPLADWQQSPGEPILKNLRLAKFVLDPPRPELRARIARRFEAMVEAGGMDGGADAEKSRPRVALRQAAGPAPADRPGGRADTSAQALEEAITATRQFAKRQNTWFRNRMADYVWFKPLESNIYVKI